MKIFEYYIIGIIEIFIVSIIGYFLPLYLLKIINVNIEDIHEKVTYRCIKSFAAGIILGLALLHLLAEAMDLLADHVEYPIANLMALIGFMVTLGLEQIALHIMLSISINNNNNRMENKKDMNNEKNNDNDNNYDNLELTDNIPELQIHSIELGSHNHIHEHVHSKQMVPDKDLNKSFIKSIVLDLAISCHSIIVGFSLGVTKDIGTVKVLLIGLGLHQFFEGFGLGTALLEGKISSKYQYIFGIVFASTAPIGIILGMYATNSETDNIVAGYADAFASGTLIYTSVVDMIAEDYMDNNFKYRHIGKTLMYFSLTLGVTVMAIIAIWA